MESFPVEGDAHVPVGTTVHYNTIPPTSGDHYAVPQPGGFYRNGIVFESLVAAMENGAVVIYFDGSKVSQEAISRFQVLAAAHPGNFGQVIVHQYFLGPDSPYSIILTAWTHRLRLTAYDPGRIDGFLSIFLGHGPNAPPIPPPEVIFTDPGIESFPVEGNAHVPVGTVVQYNTAPPTSGDHYEVGQPGGFYRNGIVFEALVASMENGAVVIYMSGYQPPGALTYFQRLAAEHPGNFGQVIVHSYGSPYAVTLTAWTHRLRLETYDEGRIDGFLALFLGHGPNGPPLPSSK